MVAVRRRGALGLLLLAALHLCGGRHVSELSSKYAVRRTYRVHTGGASLSEFLLAQLDFDSASAVKRNVRRGMVFVNGHEADMQGGALSAGDEVSLVERTQAGEFARDEDTRMRVRVAYEDDHCAVVEKAFHMPMFAAAAEDCFEGPSLHSALLHSLAPAGNSGGDSPLRRPQAVHRLDTLTGGQVLVAKTKPALVALSRLFSGRAVVKKYLALVPGVLAGEGDVRSPVDGKEAHSHYRALGHCESRSFGALTTVEVTLHTGRTHQIRRHLDSLGHPVVGDPRYWFRHGGRAVFEPYAATRHMYLWSSTLEFSHPLLLDAQGGQKRVRVESPEPALFLQLKRSESDALPIP